MQDFFAQVLAAGAAAAAQEGNRPLWIGAETKVRCVVVATIPAAEAAVIFRLNAAKLRAKRTPERHLLRYPRGYLTLLPPLTPLTPLPKTKKARAAAPASFFGK